MKPILLHICCGPCATQVIDILRAEYAVTGFFYNPNIHPADEYARRLDAAETVCERFGAKFVEGRYDPESFFEAVRGLETEPENGARCRVCYRLRLEAAARFAAENGFDLMAGTLTVGPMKRAAVIDPIGTDAARSAGVEFLAGDWKKNDGFRRSCRFSRELGIYRQHYCGCRFSIRD